MPSLFAKSAIQAARDASKGALRNPYSTPALARSASQERVENDRRTGSRSL